MPAAASAQVPPIPELPDLLRRCPRSRTCRPSQCPTFRTFRTFRIRPTCHPSRCPHLRSRTCLPCRDLEAAAAGGGAPAGAPAVASAVVRHRRRAAPPAVVQPVVAAGTRGGVATAPPPLAVVAKERRCSRTVARRRAERRRAERRLRRPWSGSAAASTSCRARSGACSYSGREWETRRRERARAWLACSTSGVQRVRRIERRGLRRARALDRSGACGAAAGGGAPVVSATGLTVSSGGGSTPGDESLGGGTPANGGDGSRPADGGSGDVRGESATQPPDLGGPHEQSEGTSLWVALGLMLLAGVAGFATPALRDRLRGASTTPRASSAASGHRCGVETELDGVLEAELGSRGVTFAPFGGCRGARGLRVEVTLELGDHLGIADRARLRSRHRAAARRVPGGPWRLAIADSPARPSDAIQGIASSRQTRSSSTKAARASSMSPVNSAAKPPVPDTAHSITLSSSSRASEHACSRNGRARPGIPALIAL